jgi:ATP synthase protein I
VNGPDDRASGDRKLDELGRRLEAFERRAEATGTLPKKIKGPAPSSALGAAMKLSTEFVAAAVVGGAMGWLIDWGLGTRPWFFIAMMLLGIGAGFLNVFRAARVMQARDAEFNRHAASVRDEPED